MALNVGKDYVMNKQGIIRLKENSTLDTTTAMVAMVGVYLKRNKKAYERNISTSEHANEEGIEETRTENSELLNEKSMGDWMGYSLYRQE